MPSEQKPTTAQLRGEVGSKESRPEAHEAAPAAAPLGTDDEAAGMTASGDRVERAQEAERKIQEAARKSR